MILLTNQLAVMLETGVPLTEALEGITERTENPQFGAVLQGVTEVVAAGGQLSTALAGYPKAFPPVMVALLQASEASGTMSAMFGRIAEYLTKEDRTIKQIRGALMYPAFMFVMCVGITIFLLTFVLPKFASIYSAKNAVLPGPTRFLMWVSGALIEYWPLWLLGVAGLTAFLVLWPRTARGRQQCDWLKLNVPVVSLLFSKLYLSRGCRTIGSMLEAGVPLLETVGIVRGVTRNTYYDRMWDEVADDLRSGRPFSHSMHVSPVIPAHIAQMIESGESAGRLAMVFTRVADFCEAELDQAVKTTTQFIEPVMIVTMGSIIGFVAIALLMPIFSVGKVVAGG